MCLAVWQSDYQYSPDKCQIQTTSESYTCVYKEYVVLFYKIENAIKYFLILIRTIYGKRHDIHRATNYTKQRRKIIT